MFYYESCSYVYVFYSYYGYDLVNNKNIWLVNMFVL